MTTWPQIAVTQDSTLLPLGARQLLDNVEPSLLYSGPVDPSGNQSIFALDGPMMTWPGIQDGIALVGGVKGLTAQFKHIDLKPARAAGVIWQGTTFDPLEVDLQLQAHANTPEGLSKVWSEWEGAWDPRILGKFEYITQDRGYWYFPARLNKPWADTAKQSPRRLRVRNITHSARCDLAFWFGMPYVSVFQTSSGSGFLPLMNIGSEDGWPSIICYGPGTFSFSNGPGSTTMISFGPLEAGDVAVVNTFPPLRGVVDISSSGYNAATSENFLQNLLQTIVNFVTNDNVPPLAQWFESLFGVLPPQSPLYSLLNGRLTNPIPGVPQPSWATLNYLSVSITGGSSSSKMIGRIDPMRRSPE